MCGILLLHLFKRRYIGVFVDPVLACNLRCRMCYFSDENKRKEMNGVMTEAQLNAIAKALFHRALKLQIGCGAEPTLFAHLNNLITLGKQHRVPYISITTNGQLIDEKILVNYIHSGLDELTLSMHGVEKLTYEYLMENAEYEKFLNLLSSFRSIKSKYPGFKIRINYTMNELNFAELGNLFSLEGADSIDVLQLRPIQKIGESAYDNFSHQAIAEHYDEVINKLRTLCEVKNIVFIAPNKSSFVEYENENTSSDQFVEATYCYASPRFCWKDGFDPFTDTFESYSKKHKLAWKYFKGIFIKEADLTEQVTKKLKYDIN